MRKFLFLLILTALPLQAQETETPEQTPPEAADETQAATPAATPAETSVIMPEPAPPEPLIIPAEDHELDEYLWLARPLVIFADSPRDPRFLQQMEYLEERPEDLAARDVVVIIDTSPEARSPIREALRPRGFALVLIGKDGQIYLRKPLPWHVREITRSIDKMPMRQQELRDQRQ